MFVGGKERKINSIINSNIRENKKQHLKFYQFRCFMVGEETHETTPLPRVIENYCLLGECHFLQWCTTNKVLLLHCYLSPALRKDLLIPVGPPTKIYESRKRCMKSPSVRGRKG